MIGKYAKMHLTNSDSIYVWITEWKNTPAGSETLFLGRVPGSGRFQRPHRSKCHVYILSNSGLTRSGDRCTAVLKARKAREHGGLIFVHGGFHEFKTFLGDNSRSYQTGDYVGISCISRLLFRQCWSKAIRLHWKCLDNNKPLCNSWLSELRCKTEKSDTSTGRLVGYFILPDTKTNRIKVTKTLKY